MNYRISMGLILVAALVSSIGCGKAGHLSGLVPAKGVVTYKGSPVEGATVMFIPDGAESLGQRTASAMTDAEGKFVTMTLQPEDGIFPGPYKVTIKQDVPDKVYTKEELEAHPMGLPAPTYTNKLPAKYADAKSTPLSITLEKKGDTGIMFELTD